MRSHTKKAEKSYWLFIWTQYRFLAAPVLSLATKLPMLSLLLLIQIARLRLTANTLMTTKAPLVTLAIIFVVIKGC